MRLIKVGGLHPNPFARRHHTKAFIIDDYALVGGTNLTDDTFGHYDFMLEFHDPKIADALYKALPRIAVERNDAIIPIDKQSRFIVDGGRPGVSPILDTAVELAQGAEKIWYASKMLPDPRLAEAILAVPGQYCYYGHMDKGGLFNRTTIRRDYARSPLHNLYDGDKTLHAKAIVAQYRDGSLRALTGSNNFNQRGVNWGTQEIALDTKDQSICTAVLGFIERLPQKQLR